MKLLTQKIIKNPLVSSSFIMLIGTNLYNASQFLYHSLTGRFLGKAYYGDLAALISILGLISIVQLSFGLTIIKFIASQKDKRKLANLIKWISLWSIVGGISLGLITLIIAPFISKFLNLQQIYGVYVLVPTVAITIIVTAYRSILQGILEFKKYVISFISEAAAKIILLILFIALGLTVFKGILAIFLSIIFGLLVARLFLGEYLKGKRGEKPEVAPIVRYSMPVLIQGLALTSMYSTDLMLVKHFFTPEQAGLYASLIILGRIVFFGASPITNVMFPLIVKRHSDGEPYHNILYLSTVLVGLVSLSIVSLYLFLPSLPINILYGQGYLEGAPLLWLFGLFMSLLGLSVLFIQFYLSIGKTKVVWLFVLAALLQAVLIWFLHGSIETVVKNSIITSALLLFSLLVYFPYHHKK
ncbi:oligosaccharide flippase family protein [Candidatus Microgenomates bacterium]|nr:oligosaccharide flippase family protein [Candidatus Microgenomates bacterium]